MFSVGTQPFHFLVNQFPFQGCPASPAQPTHPHPAAAASSARLSPAQPQIQNQVKRKTAQNLRSKLSVTQTLNNFSTPQPSRQAPPVSQPQPHPSPAPSLSRPASARFKIWFQNKTAQTFRSKRFGQNFWPKPCWHPNP